MKGINSIIYQVNKLLRKQLQTVLNEYDITIDQWLILRKVYYDSGRYNQKELTELCFKERAAITRMLDNMQKRNWIERRNSPEDRREYLIYIMEDGKKLYENTADAVDQMEECISSILKEDEVEELFRMMEHLKTELSKSL